jgi:hypothetical protein
MSNNISFFKNYLKIIFKIPIIKVHFLEYKDFLWIDATF